MWGGYGHGPWAWSESLTEMMLSASVQKETRCGSKGRLGQSACFPRTSGRRDAVGSAPYHLPFPRLRPANSFHSPRSAARRQSRPAPCARDPYFRPGIFPATSTNGYPRCLVASAATPCRPQSPCPSHISTQEWPRMDSAADRISCPSGRARRTAPTTTHRAFSRSSAAFRISTDLNPQASHRKRP